MQKYFMKLFQVSWNAPETVFHEMISKRNFTVYLSLKKRCPEIMQQIYKGTPMPKLVNRRSIHCIGYNVFLPFSVVEIYES